MVWFKIIVGSFFISAFSLSSAYVLHLGKKETGIKLDYVFTAIALILFNMFVW